MTEPAKDISEQEVKRRLSDQRVLLVGGAGFIGHNLALHLRRLGVETMVADNLMVNSLVGNVYGQRGEGLQRDVYLQFLLSRFDLMRDVGVNLHNCDARLMTDLSRCFEEFSPTKVVNLSGISSAVDARKDPGLCFDLALVTTRNVLELVRQAKGHINEVMFMSSSTVYGDFETPIVDENTRPRPRGIYANTKYMGERLMRTYNHQHGIGTCIIRPSALYGERCVSRRVSQIFIENAMLGKPLLLEGGGDGRLDFTYIADLVDGMARALAFHRGPETSETFNLTFGNARTIAELAAIVKEIVPDAVLEEKPRAEDKPIRGTLSTDRARDILGFEAKWNLETGYRQYCQWYVETWERVKARSNAG